MPTKEAIADVFGEFTYMWGMHFFIETSLGNFVWADPNYQGDNTMTLFSGSYQDYCKKHKIDFGRSKGTHQVGHYCGTDFTVVIPQ